MANWDARFLDMARLVSSWSKDPSTQAGAVITDGNRMVSVGFNGFPRGISDDERLAIREVKYEMVVHAEVNAVLFARRSLVGLTLYTWPIPSCSRCAAVVIQSGISKVVYPHPNERAIDLWKRMNCDLTIALFSEAHVRTVGVDTSTGVIYG